MKITPDVFEAYLKCSTKCWLRANGIVCNENHYAEWVKERNATYREVGTGRLVAAAPSDDVSSTPHIENAKAAKWRLACSLEVQSQMDSHVMESEIHMTERVSVIGRGKAAQFIPIHFIFKNKLTKDDKLLLAFDAFVLAQALKRGIAVGKIIHGDENAAFKVKTSTLAGEVRKRLVKISALISSPAPPDLVLNRHCAECEFQARCRKKALETDDLSLLAGLGSKERQKLRSKGIFTVTQLSYTFRPRRRPKRMRDKREKYHHSLKALAIREKKIHIVGSPELKIEGTPIYLDVEGVPDRDFYYLIGLRIGNGENAVQHSLWADTVEDEGKIWREFLAILETVENPVLIHYGSYETIFIRRMRERYGQPDEDSAAASRLVAALNLVSVIFARVYFVSFTNGLKEIAGSLGFAWSDSTLSGAMSVVQHFDWTASRKPAVKQALIIYNAEDCSALEVVVNKLLELNQTSLPAEISLTGEFVDAEEMKRQHPYGFKRNTFAFPDLNAINKAAYWDYQRERIYVKSNKRLAGLFSKKPKGLNIMIPNRTIEYARPAFCPKCDSPAIFKHTKSRKMVIDLLFMRHGIKRWITLFLFHNYQCQNCGAVFHPQEESLGRGKYGQNLIAYAVYLIVELRLPQIQVDAMFYRIFKLYLPSASCSQRFKMQAANRYRASCQKILQRLCSGHLLHVDETKISIRGKNGFVWVFTNMVEVVYFYSETREGEMIQTLLSNFKGVLVSDFYTVYDAIQCPQQKCLIHLIRDLNDDVLKRPYDEELRWIVSNFSALLKSMVETIDQHGLKCRFLKKHQVDVDRFYRKLMVTELKSEMAGKTKERLVKYRNKLFTFLEFDGIPWNNNNAERAVKSFAALRHIIAGVTTEKGIRDYLILLSLCETCKYMGLDFLDFLRSGEEDIHIFAESRRGRRRIPE